MNRLLWTALVVLIAAWQPGVAPAQMPDPEIAYAEKTLKDAKLGTDGDALLDVLRSRSLTEKDRETLKDKIALLGDRSFSVRDKASRDLRVAGRLALPLLKHATTNKDIEIRKRAATLIEEIEANSDSPIVLAALQLIGKRRPKGSVETLLGYSPSITDTSLTDLVLTTLATVGVKDGTVDPAIEAALKDKDDARRAAAASAYGKVTAATAKKSLTPLLTDASTNVRFHASRSLLMTGEKSAMPVMIALLAEGTQDEATLAEDVLFTVAAEKSPAISAYGDEQVRKRARVAWEGWWKANGETASLKKLHELEPVLGLTLICEPFIPNGGGRVFELDADGRKKWEVKAQTPLDAQVLPGGRILIADHNGFVNEVDKDGKEHWKYNIPNPVSVQRLPNGNTFISSYTQIVEVTRDGKEVYKIVRQANMFYALKLKTGNIVCVTSHGTILELDTTGKELHKITVPATGGWGCVQLLPNGNFIVTCSSANQVVEVDRTGKVVWKVTVNNPMSGRRLRNGNTLVASHDDKQVYEYDSTGKVVWKFKVEGYPFQAHRR